MKGELTCQCCEYATKIYTHQLQGLYRLDTALFKIDKQVNPLTG